MRALPNTATGSPKLTPCSSSSAEHVGPSASFVVDSLEFDSDQEAATIILLLSGSAGEGEMVARIRKGDGSGDGEGFDVIEAKLNVPVQAPLSLLPGSKD